MTRLTDQQLLRDYSERRSEAAFAELVRRHVDLVYSAALRMVCDSHLAEDVTQGAFVALARSAPQLTERPVLSGWLHRTAQNIAAQTVRTDVRRRAREQEAAAMNKLLATGPDDVWEQIAPHLDAALGELNEPDRDALILRYFERKSAQEMAQVLGVSDEAAQKRLSRAVERLRELFAKRGVTVGASGLLVVLSANAVQAAPIGLAITISSAAATLAGATITTITTTATTTQALAMTTLQKSLITAAFAVAVGTGIYEARQASELRSLVGGLQQHQAPLAEQINQLQQERDDATGKLAAVLAENEQLKSSQNSAELLRLRSEMARLRQQLARSPTVAETASDPFVQNVLALTERAAALNQYLEEMPDRQIPELELLSESDWLDAAKEARFDTETDVRKALSRLRSTAKSRLPMGGALGSHIQANNGQLPSDVSQLKPYLKPALGSLALDDRTVDSILARYKLLHAGNVIDLPADTWIIAEKAPVDKEYDSRAKFGNGRSTVIGTGIGSAGDPDDNSY